MNIKKIGLSALAGSLAMVSANAVEVAVSGKTELTYVSKDKASVGNPFGMGNALTFSGSGDMNGMTATYTAVLGDGGQANSNTSETFASSSLMIDMGDLGTVGFDAGVGEFGVSTIDDKTPYAYEEQWTYVGSTNGLRAAGGVNVFGYKHSYAGVNLTLEIDPGHGPADVGTTGDGASTGGGTTDSGYNFALTSSEMYDGVNMGIGYGNEEQSDSKAAANFHDKDETYTTAFVTYAFGAATVGYQLSAGYGGSVGNSSNEVEIYGISYSVNENLALSYSEMDNEFGIGTKSGAYLAGGVTEETKGFGASYTMGSAAVRVLASEADNIGGASGNNEKHMEVSLMLAF
jgi:outer membrane protein OmpU